MAESPQEDTWYFKLNFLVVAFFIVGPFALPLLWFNPKIKKTSKVVWSGIILFLSLISLLVMAKATRSIMDYYKLAGDLNP